MNDQWSDILETYHLASCPVPDKSCTCRMCEVIEGVAQLEAGNEQLIQILQELEWQGHDAMSDVCCPSCGGFKPNDHGGGHYENCRLKEALGVEKSGNF